MNYPKSKKVNQVDNYHGTNIEDPYRWLEDLNSTETKEWIDKQNKFTEEYLNKIDFRGKIKQSLTENTNYPKYGVPFKKGDFYYYFKNEGLQNHSVLYKQKTLDSKSETFIDPNKFSKDGTSSLSSLSFSKDSKFIAYGIAKAGSEWSEIKIMNSETKELLSETLTNIQFDSGAGYHKVIWFREGFFYTKFDEISNNETLTKKQNCKLMYHKINTNQSKDILIYEDKKNPKLVFGLSNSKDEKYLYIYPNAGNHYNTVLIRNNETEEIKTLIDDYKNENEIVHNKDENFYILTNKKASNKHLIKINIANTKEKETIIPETQHLLEDILEINEKLICCYLENAHSKIELFDLETKEKKEIKLPVHGTAFSFSPDKEENCFYFSLISFNSPNEIYKYEIKKKELTKFRKTTLKINTEIETKQIWFESKDKTKVPMFIVHKKDLEINENTPALLYGYGGFNVSLTPYFSLTNLLFIEKGGIFAMPNLRGGGEFGENWHKQGMQENKQNVFDDFTYAAKYLIENKYTSPNKLAIMGGSNGGLLVSACLTQNPKLYKLAMPIVGVLDMLRFHEFTNGRDWIEDYGCSENEKDFKYLIKYSPIHNVKKQNYPTTFIMTSNNDDNVVPSHSYKFTATLQENQTSKNPIYISIQKDAGHQGGVSTQRRIEEQAQRLSVIFKELNIKF